MPRPQFTVRALLVAMLVVGAFFRGAEFGAKREQERLASERAKVEASRDKVTSWLRQIAKYYDGEAASAYPDEYAPRPPLPFNDLEPNTEKASREHPEPLSWPATRPATRK